MCLCDPNQHSQQVQVLILPGMWPWGKKKSLSSLSSRQKELRHWRVSETPNCRGIWVECNPIFIWYILYIIYIYTFIYIIYNCIIIYYVTVYIYIFRVLFCRLFLPEVASFKVTLSYSCLCYVGPYTVEYLKFGRDHKNQTLNCDTLQPFNHSM